jgi:prepilin-type processing-associated H-X9-DG protein
MVESASQLLLFGDGHSDWGGWPNDRWWIWKYDVPNSPGFNRVAQGDKGAVRHNRRSNYALADGSGSYRDILKNKEEQGGGGSTDLHRAHLGIYKGL